MNSSLQFRPTTEHFGNVYIYVTDTASMSRDLRSLSTYLFKSLFVAVTFENPLVANV